jgi:hypothetical protein
MGCRVHVIKKHAEYGDSEAFNWNAHEFHALLDVLGCDVCGEEYADDFECTVESYKDAVKVVAVLKKGDEARADQLLDKISEERSTGDLSDVKGQLEKCGGIDYVLDAMVSFLVERDKDSNWISFCAF